MNKKKNQKRNTRPRIRWGFGRSLFAELGDVDLMKRFDDALWESGVVQRVCEEMGLDYDQMKYRFERLYGMSITEYKKARHTAKTAEPDADKPKISEKAKRDAIFEYIFQKEFGEKPVAPSLIKDPVSFREFSRKEIYVKRMIEQEVGKSKRRLNHLYKEALSSLKRPE